MDNLDERVNITADGPKVLLVERQDMLDLLLKVKAAEAGNAEVSKLLDSRGDQSRELVRLRNRIARLSGALEKAIFYLDACVETEVAEECRRILQEPAPADRA